MLWGALALAAGCHGDQVTCLCVPVTAAVNEAWAGTKVTLTSSAFVGADSLPTLVTTGSDTLAMAVAGTGAIAVTMPQNDGAYTLAVTLHSGEVLTTDELRVHGFLGAAQGPLVTGRFEPVPGYPDPTGVVYGPLGRLTLVNLGTGVATPLGAASDTGFGNGCLPGVTVATTTPVLVTVGRSTTGGSFCSVLAADIAASVSIVDSAPATGGGLYASIYFGAGRWVVGRKNNSVVVPGPGATYADPCGSALGMVAAPQPSHLVVPVGCYLSGSPLPVWDARTGLHAYTLGFLKGIGAAAFTPDGDTLFLAARVNDSVPAGYRLMDVDAATGSARRSAMLPGFYDLGSHADMVLDPNRRWLYVAYGDPLAGSDVHIKVFDRTTLQEVATWHTPSLGDDGNGPGLWMWRLAVGAAGVLYLITTREFADPVTPWIYRWSLMP